MMCHDWHRLRHEWNKQHKWAAGSKLVFAIAALGNTFDVLVHIVHVVVSSMTLLDVDHDLVHSLEHWSLVSAAIATVAAIIISVRMATGHCKAKQT